MSEYDPIDFNGRVIKAGDEVVYPVRSGSDMWLSRAKVSVITCDKRGRYTIECICTTAAGRDQRVQLKHPDRCVVMCDRGKQ